MTDLQLELDRSSPVPLYFQIARQIEVAIERGDLAPGDRLEDEVGLADRYGLSRPTMRRAIQELVAKGLLVRKRGVGTQVVHGQVTRRVELTSLWDDLTEHRQQPSTLLIVRETQPAEDDIAERLGVPPGSELIYLERVRSTHGKPLAVMRNWLPVTYARVLTAENLERRGLYELLRSTGVHMRVATQRIGARTATPTEAKLLAVARNFPVLTMERTTYGDSGVAFELARHAFRADSYSFELTLVNR